MLLLNFRAVAHRPHWPYFIFIVMAYISSFIVLLQYVLRNCRAKHGRFYRIVFYIVLKDFKFICVVCERNRAILPYNEVLERSIFSVHTVLHNFQLIFYKPSYQLLLIKPRYETLCVSGFCMFLICICETQFYLVSGVLL
jgi:hypothetical protein